MSPEATPARSTAELFAEVRRSLSAYRCDPESFEALSALEERVAYVERLRGALTAILGWREYRDAGVLEEIEAIAKAALDDTTHRALPEPGFADMDDLLKTKTQARAAEVYTFKAVEDWEIPPGEIHARDANGSTAGRITNGPAADPETPQ